MSNNLTFHPAPGDDTPHARAFFEDMTRRLNTWPDLLAACEKLIDTLDQYEGSHAGLDEARAAVRKAKGEAT